MNNNYVWVVSLDWSFDGMEQDSKTYVFAKYEDAKKMFDSCVAEDKENEMYQYRSEFSPYCWDEDEYNWCIWNDDNYCADHSCVTMEKMLVR